jgi:hypothetical protein
LLIDDYFWLLEYLTGDSLLVHPPTLKNFREIRAYHSILLVKFKIVAGESYYEQGFDALATSFENDYFRIARMLTPSFDVNLLTSMSRHKFFIANEQQNNVWISGLEQLMGLSFKQPEDNKTSVNLTSGDIEIDIIAGLLLQENLSNIAWLINNKSPQFLIRLLGQINNYKRGQEALDEAQRQVDLSKSTKVEEKLAKSGFSF